MGDWAKGYFVTQNFKPGTDFNAIRVPGPNKAFVFSTDTFNLPVGAQHRDGAIALLEVMASPQAQTDFNLVKGSIPARPEADLSGYDSISQGIAADFKAGPIVFSVGAPSPYMNAVLNQLQAFIGDRNIDALVATLVQNYSSLVAQPITM
jgi:glucose/mannose transport system substrate-binding protein